MKTSILIDDLMHGLGLEQNDFANTLGVSSQAVTNWKRRGLKPTALHKIKLRFPNVNMHWLLTGEGEMFAEIPDEKKQSDDEKGIPLIPTNAIGGALSGTDLSFMEYETEKYFIPAFRKSDFLIRVDGDSMEPKYLRGDVVACTYVNLTDIWFQWGKVYVISTNQGALIKHVEKGSDDNHIKLVSDNPSYKPFEIDKRDMHGVALVNGLIRVE